MTDEMPPNMTLHTGDLFTTSMPALGHGVNVDGVMGAGIAKVVRARNPEVYEVYRAACRAKTLLPGQMLPAQTVTGRWVLNLASQDRPGPNARLIWFEQALNQTFRFAEARRLVGFAIPRIGAGIGGLDWAEVFAVIVETAVRFPHIRIEVWSLEADANPVPQRSLYTRLGEGLRVLDAHLPAAEQRVPERAAYLADGSSWLRVPVDPKAVDPEVVGVLRRLGWRVAPDDAAFEFRWA